MPGRVITRSFSSGVFSPEYIGRTELRGYDAGLALADNWFVRPSGALMTRPGTQYIAGLPNVKARLFGIRGFRRSLSGGDAGAAVAMGPPSDYVLIFSAGAIHFVADGAVVLAGSYEKTITYNPVRFTSGANPLAVGTLLRVAGGPSWLQGLTLRVSTAVVAGTQLNPEYTTTVTDVDGVALPSITDPATTVRVEVLYSIAAPYTAEQLDDLSVAQSAIEVCITHPAQPVMRLYKRGGVAWLLVTDPVSFDGAVFATDYPAVSATFQQRQLYANTPSHPVSIYGSHVGEPINFDHEAEAPAADTGYALTLDVAVSTKIQALLAAPHGLLAFADHSIWLVSGQGYWEQIAITPLSNNALVQVEISVAPPRPIVVGDARLFVEAGSHSIEALLYNGQARRFEAVGLSELVPALISEANPVVAWDFARRPNSLLYIVQTDGTMAVMAYNFDRKSGAFSRYETRGAYRDVAVVGEGNYDRAYFLIARTIDGHQRLFLEKEALRTPEIDDDHTALDCSVTRAAGTSSMSGLAHLAGETVAIRAGGAVMPSQPVQTSAVVPLEVAATTAAAGLQFTCTARTLPPTVRDSVTEGSLWLPIRVSPRVLNTRGLKIGTRLDSLTEARERTHELYGTPTDAYTGTRSMNLGHHQWRQDVQLYMVQDTPLPATVLNLVYELEIGSDL